MQEKELIGVFIDGAKAYFDHLDDTVLEIGTPYLIPSNVDLSLEFNGAIPVHGDTQGSVVFSADSSMLKYILLSLGETQLSVDYLSDLVGEIANTIAGNARRSLGDSFQIFPPKVSYSSLKNVKLDYEKRAFVLPLRWKSKRAQLLVSLGDSA